MKKLLFTLLTAACFAGAASAITGSWTESTTGEIKDLEVSGSYTIAYKFMLTELPTTLTKLFSISTGEENEATASNWIALAVRDGTTQNVRLYSANTDTACYTKSTNVGQLQEGENIVALVVTRESGNAYFDIYINGGLYASSSSGLKWTGSGNTYGTNVYTTIEDESSYGGTLYYVNEAASVADIAALPEPTALALLALGAAGLALRRKMA